MNFSPNFWASCWKASTTSSFRGPHSWSEQLKNTTFIWKLIFEIKKSFVSLIHLKRWYVKKAQAQNTEADKWHGHETATKDSWNGDKRHKDKLKLRQRQRKVQIQWYLASSSIHCTRSDEFWNSDYAGNTYPTPSPPRESHNFFFFLSLLADLYSCNSLSNRQRTHVMHIGKQERRYWIFVSGDLFHRHVLRCVLTWPQWTTFSQNVSAKNGAESRSLAQCKGFLESGVQGNFVCGIRKTVQGVRIPVTIGIQNPSIKDWNTVPGICGVEARIQECLRFPYMGRGDS